MHTPDVNPHCEQCHAFQRSIFASLGKEEIEKLFQEKTCFSYKRGQRIVEEGKYADGIYCIHSGKIKVFREGEEGKEQIVRFATGGDILGYKAIITQQPYVNSAEALEESHLCYIPRDVFFQVIRANPAFAVDMMAYISRELRATEEQMVHLAQKPLRARLAELLLILKATFGTVSDGKTIDVVLTREDIANILGTATESAIRMISDFHHEGYIELQGKRIRLENVEGLQREAHIEHP